MRTLRIRSFLVLCFLLLLLLPWIFYVTAYFLENQTLSFMNSRQQDEALQSQLNEVVAFIEAGTAKWTDADWQSQLQKQLKPTKIDVSLQTETGADIYRSNPDRRGSRASTERYTIMESGQLLGKAILYLPRSNQTPVMSALAGLLFAFIIIGMEMRRFLLRPLERMSAAARQIADGDWDVQLPQTRMTEIAEVRDGFDVMVKGMQTAYRKQAELEEERRFVIAAVAHDLRTPLFALRGYLDGLEQGIAKSPEKAARYLAVCKEKSAQLDRLVEDLFTFTKMEYAESSLKQESADLASVIRKSLDSVSPAARHKDISFTSELPEGCIVSGDAHLLERAISNLLDNAVRHTPPEGGIFVHCGKAERRVTFAIHDPGPGFAEEELQRAFEPLYRGETSRNRSTGGSGLGLTIAQRIVRRHGGELAVSNHTDGGAQLTGWLPAYAPVEKTALHNENKLLG
ncbi:sensor histidine kinase [Paenibacillus sp. 1011MAR3C5]|uniref:sensor histidine kinase n=1 Tax=Paenibacillus sp. 1011MAR3C5 TaxID=1675787 RepID=UPI000E6B9539|nr:HAMP domain-containing sensor histidine kinase [Paenibacillus sp. 1011MAR3C5]RJE91338.1 sensor histidine kinase [Paenibacillus sp. 1011MAR3C5]